MYLNRVAGLSDPNSDEAVPATPHPFLYKLTWMSCSRKRLASIRIWQLTDSRTMAVKAAIYSLARALKWLTLYSNSVAAEFERSVTGGTTV